MPAVNGVGELGAGEPHAQFDGRALETGRPRSAIRGSRAGVLRDATTMAWTGPSRSTSHYRASARPYSITRWWRRDGGTAGDTCTRGHRSRR
jgi:hypothetical protein